MNRLRFTPFATEYDLRLAVVEAGRIAYEHGLMVANDGNISARLGDGEIVITPSGFCKGRLDLEDLVVLDLDGNVLKSNPRRHLKPSSETALHLEVYRQRPDVRGIIHAHPRIATALTISDHPLPVDMLPEVILTLGEVPVAPYSTPSTHEGADAIRDLIKEHDAILMNQGGSLTVGENLDAALIALEHLEHVAEVYFYAHLLGKVNKIPAESIAKLVQVARKSSQPDDE